MQARADNKMKTYEGHDPIACAYHILAYVGSIKDRISSFRLTGTVDRQLHSHSMLTYLTFGNKCMVTPTEMSKAAPQQP